MESKPETKTNMATMLLLSNVLLHHELSITGALTSPASHRYDAQATGMILAAGQSSPGSTLRCIAFCLKEIVFS
jgi:hypothetical protein